MRLYFRPFELVFGTSRMLLGSLLWNSFHTIVNPLTMGVYKIEFTEEIHRIRVSHFSGFGEEL
jgi:hypothetical protein